MLAVAAAAGCAPSGESFELRDETMRSLRASRPFALRIDARAEHRPCDRESVPSLLELRCAPIDGVTTAVAPELAARVARAAAESPGTDALWAAALLDLWSAPDDRRAVDRAVARLEAVRIRRPGDAAALDHLAVATIARGLLTDDPRELQRGLDFVEQAVAADSTDVAARWNRAVLLSGLYADSTAARARDWIAMHERTAPWRDEARAIAARRRAYLIPEGVPPPSLARFQPHHAQWAREWVMDSLLKRWSAAQQAGDSGAAFRSVRDARKVGTQLLALNGDSSVLLLAADLERLGARVGAVGPYLAGMHHWSLTEYEAAQPLLYEASRAATQDGMPLLAAWARLSLAAVLWSRDRFPEALAMVREVRATARSRRSLALEARALWLESLIAARSADIGRAEASLAIADSLFVSLGEYGNVGFLRAVRGVSETYASRPREAARYTLQGLLLPVRSGRAPRYEQWLSLSDQLIAQRAPFAAVAILDEAVIHARSGSRPKDLPETLARRAGALLLVGRAEDAAADIRAARAALPAIGGGDMQRRTTAEVDRVAADLLMRSDPDSALALSTRARRTFDEIPLERPAMLVRHGSIRLFGGDTSGARTDLQEAVRLAELRAGTGTDADRRATRHALRDARRGLALLALAAADTTGAITQASEIIADGATGRGGEPTDERARDSQRLSLVTLPDRVLAWLETPTATEVHVAQVTAPELARLVREFRTLVRTGADTAGERSVAERLHQVLLGSLAAQMVPGGPFHVRSDEALGELPLGALRSSDGAFLSERVSLVTLASAEGPQANGARKSASTGRLLIVEPAIDSRTFPEFDPLPWAEREARTIGGIDPRAELLQGPAATVEAFRRVAVRAGALHFAGHAVVEPTSQGRSFLALSSGSGGVDGRLPVAELAALDLRGMRLAVLSACGRSSSVHPAEQPVNELVQAFIAAGVGSVVAGLWEVEDAGMATVMEWFHRELADGAAPSEALRRVQLRGVRGTAEERRAAFALMVYSAAVERR